jgi:diguanylate cyclase (GGDEF)-like protein/PAS domain S-box-containing protein
MAKQSNPILIVEDDKPTCKVLVKILSARFEQVLVAKDGDEGLELFLHHRPALVITDIRMPMRDGISMAREIKTRSPSTKIIVITSYGSADLLLAAIEIGVTDYILKPLDPARVNEAVDKSLQVDLLEHKLLDARAQTENVLESIRDAFFALDKDGRFTYLNLKAESFFGLPRPEILGSRLVDVLSSDAGYREQILEAIEAQESRSFECHSPSRKTWHEARIFPLEGGISVYLRDITDSKQAQEEIRFLAYYDRLTRLPNRTLLQDRVVHSIRRCLKGDHQGALLFMDLDRFKNINDSLGHEAGDRVLQEAATRLRNCIRECDTVARLGGDEFIILLDGIDTTKHIHVVIERILNALAQEINQNGVQLSLTASIGVSLIPGDGESVEDLLKAADTAMYYSKRQGGNSYHFYRPEMNARTQALLVMESTLRKSFQNKDFHVDFQPQYQLAGHRLVGFEALVRWSHPELGLVMPSDFIPLAEQTGLILPLGEWVLETACRQGMAWADQHGRPVRMAVNVSGRQFWQGDLVGTVSRVLAATGFPPALLELELTESMIMNDVELAIGTMHKLADMDVRMSLDDFGTGYSSLASLQKFPIRALKIDKSFVKDLTSNPNDLAISRSIIGLAHSLKLETIAEGIETHGQLESLLDLGCESGQGYHFSAPVSAVQAARFFRTEAPADRRQAPGPAPRTVSKVPTKAQLSSKGDWD